MGGGKGAAARRGTDKGDGKEQQEEGNRSCRIAQHQQRKRDKKNYSEAYRRRWAGAALGVIDVCAGALSQLLKQEGPFYPQLLNLALYASEPEPGSVVGILDLVCSVLQLDTLPPVGFLDRRRQRRGHAGWLNVSLGNQFSLGRHCRRGRRESRIEGVAKDAKVQKRQGDAVRRGDLIEMATFSPNGDAARQ